MTRRVHIELVDDLDNGPADEVVSFSLDEKQYTIDLSAKNAEALRSALAKYVAVASVTPSVGGSTDRSRAAKKKDGPRAGDVRGWAQSQGMTVSDRGRIPNDLMVKFQAAHV